MPQRLEDIKKAALINALFALEEQGDELADSRLAARDYLTRIAAGQTRMAVDPTGRCFVGYRPSRTAECVQLVAALRDRGLPTSRDVYNLDEERPRSEMRRAVNDPGIASAVLLLTPEVGEGAVSQLTEAQAILDRARHTEGFFVVPVLADGLDYNDADKFTGPDLSMNDLRQWNIYKAREQPINAAEATGVANRVLRRRLATIHFALPKDEPVRLNLSTRTPPAWQSGMALVFDWTGHFSGREATKETWQEILLPALEDVALAIEQFAPERAVEATGLLSLAAATALGCTFLAPRGIPIAWRQYTPGRGEQVWSIDVKRESSGFQAVATGADASADDLAVLVMVNDDVGPAVYASRDHLPRFRAIVEVANPGSMRSDLSTPGLAADVAFLTAEAMRKARTEYGQPRRVHLFTAVPAGLAMMIGQLLNNMPPVQTYELTNENGANIYRPAGLLSPGE
jgi:hypothetical protein